MSADLGRVEALLARVTYKPGWTIGVRDLGDPYAPLVLVTTRQVPNSYRPSQTILVNTRSVIPPSIAAADEDRFYDWLRREMHHIETHETDEFLRIDGEMRWDPHANDAPRFGV